MKKSILIICFIILGLSSNAHTPVINCEDINKKVIEKEHFINKITGIRYTTEKFIEAIIEHELNKELNSRINADITSFNIKQLKNGEFEKLSLKGKKVDYKNFTMSNFNACTICKYNKVIYNGTKVYYPTDIPFNFKADITDEDINNAVNSEVFQKALVKKDYKINGMSVFSIGTPKITINQNRINYVIPIKTVLGEFPICFDTDIDVKNNTIMLTDIQFDLIVPIKIKIFNKIKEEINPFKYDLSSIKGKYCKIYVTKAKISDNIINTEGVFIINKNYNGEQ